MCGAVEGAVEVGQQLTAAVLDYSRAEGIVDLTLRPALVAAAEAAHAAGPGRAADGKGRKQKKSKSKVGCRGHAPGSRRAHRDVMP